MFRILVFFCCAWAELAEIDENVPKPSSARKTPARTMNRPINTRGLRKADREVDFFFMSGIGYDVDGFEVSNTVFRENAGNASTLFYFFVRAPGFIGLANEWQAFFGNFLRRTTDGSGEAAAKVAQASKCAVSRLSKAAWRTISPRPADSWVRAKVERSPRRLLSALA